MYATIGRNPLVGIAAAFAGVSAGFGANLIPATPNDVIVGVNTLMFAEQMGVPTVSYLGRPLCAPTMDYFYMASLFVLFTLLGGFVTNRIVAPRLERLPWTKPDGFTSGEFTVMTEEKRAMWCGLGGFAAALAVAALFALGPLATYVDAAGKRHTPFMENVIVFVALAFFAAGLVYGKKVGAYRTSRDIISAAAKQLGGCGYLMVLTFVSFNFLAMFNYSGLGAWIACRGAQGLIALDLGSSPCLLLIAFIALSSFVNCFISSMSAKWMLLGPVFVPLWATGVNREAVERAQRLLSRVGLGDKGDRFPGQLSGGERQRVAVARALVMSPGLVLADEPTGALDHTAAQKLIGLLLELNAEERATLIVVTHAEACAARMGRRVTLVDGRLA